jgi:superfamily II DNA or RNA helicase
MPRIFDNIDLHLLPSLKNSLGASVRADFCVGYFNLRGWKQVATCIEAWSGEEGNRCRLLVGMQRSPQDEVRELFSLVGEDGGVSNQVAVRLKKRLAEEFRRQLTIGAPTNEDEAGLRRLAAQLRDKKLVVKLFLRHPLHAKLYLLFRADYDNPVTGYLGSSNLTFSGLSGNGELNVDVLDHDATDKLARWFEDRWEDKFCLDISADLIGIIEESWAREALVPPYSIYLKMAYHLSQEAREGLRAFDIPSAFKLFAYQSAAVKIAAHHLEKRGGVLIGDVVGLGKTIMATALAKIFEESQFTSTLILCPKNLQKMWQGYVDRYGLHAKVMPMSVVQSQLADVPARFRLVLIDESHNLRNRETRRYAAIAEYIRQSGSKVILLSATPYNKGYHDLSNQLRLFVAEDADLGIRPEAYLRGLGGEMAFRVKHSNTPVRSLAAFEWSEHQGDWRELMRLYLVRRTRTFIKENYAKVDETGRRYLTYPEGGRAYFPDRLPKTVTFALDSDDPGDQYARLYAERVVDIVGRLALPRYGLGNYIAEQPRTPADPDEAKLLQNLSRAGKRLMGFSRTNLFKRLESSGAAFLLSVERHILRNHIYIHAIENGLALPIGTQDAGLLDTRFEDEDAFFASDESGEAPEEKLLTHSEAAFRDRAAEVYAAYRGAAKRRFKWLRPDLFEPGLLEHLRGDAAGLMGILRLAGSWQPSEDAKLDELVKLLRAHSSEKVLVFSQFADTVRYLESQLKARGIEKLAGVTGGSSDPTALAWRFSPQSNGARVLPDDELRVLIATDVLSEGQNLQDAFVVVNYDLPWAIIRLIQRAGRVDRIGQKARTILLYTFLPAEGVERIIRLRTRVAQRLEENAEVVGTDESFFEDMTTGVGAQGLAPLQDLYNEKAGLLDDEPDSEVDLASQAYQIWQNALERDPGLEKRIQEMPNVVFSTRAHTATPDRPGGVLVYLQTSEGNDALAWLDDHGNAVTESQFAILKAAECAPDTPALPRRGDHHALVKRGVEVLVEENRSVGGQLGRPSGARYKTYERLKRYHEEVGAQGLAPLQNLAPLQSALEEIYKYPLYPFATDLLNRKLRSGANDRELAELVIALREDDRLCIVHEEDQAREPTIVCSMGLVGGKE